MAFKDIRKSRKRLSAEEIRIIILLLIVLSAMLALNLYVARMIPAGEWLFMRWNGARAFLIEYVEPYSTAIAERTQQLVYGREAFPSEYRYVLSDPFYIVMFYSPLAILPEFVKWLYPPAIVGFDIIHSIWMLVAEVALFSAVLFSFRLSEWEPPPGLYIILIGLGLLSFFGLNALVTATPTIFLLLLYLGILLALRSSSDELAGALLCLAAYQWEVGGLFFLFITIFVLVNRRWKVLIGFGMLLIVLFIVSFLSYPGWSLPYVRAVISNLKQGANLNLNHILSAWFPNSRISIAGIVSVFLIVVMFVESLGSARAPFRRVVWTASLALTAMPLVGLAIFTSNFVVLLLPLILVLALVWERWARGRALRVALVLLVALLLPFGLYLRTVYVYDPLYADLLSVLPPVVTILALYWMRWWVLRSPRVWADQIGFRK